MDRAARNAAWIVALILLLVAVANAARSLGEAGSVDWRVPCGLALGSLLSVGIGWIAGVAAPSPQSCGEGTIDSDPSYESGDGTTSAHGPDAAA